MRVGLALWLGVLAALPCAAQDRWQVTLNSGKTFWDLGLVKLCGALRGRWADADDTRELLEPYGEWAGLASVYLLASFPKKKGAARWAAPLRVRV